MSDGTYAARRAMQRCPQCGKPDAYTLNGRCYCAECVEWRREYRKRRARENPEPAKRNTQHVSQAHRERREQGLCPDCGKPVENGRYYCKRCAAKRNARRRQKYGPIYHDPELCARCHKQPKTAGHKLCEKCYQATLAAQKKGAEARRGKNKEAK